MVTKSRGTSRKLTEGNASRRKKTESRGLAKGSEGSQTSLRHIAAEGSEVKVLQVPDVWLTTEEVAAYLRVTQKTVLHHHKESGLPAGRVGNQFRFRKADVDAWVNARGHGNSEPDGGNGHDPSLGANGRAS
jgi:excisionase family DNA binding protein